MPVNHALGSRLRYSELVGVQSGPLNVKGKPLMPCSKKENHDAMTGYDRMGRCSLLESDVGKHHVCIKMNTESNFCELTGQSNWCDDLAPCMGDSSKKCKRGGWCVCQWAFSSAVEKVGCDAIDVDCDATSIHALEAYEKNKSEHGNALACLKQKCINSNSLGSA